MRQLYRLEQVSNSEGVETALKSPPASSAIPPVLKIVALVVFAQTLFTRAVDPVIPMIAGELAIDVKTAALLSSAYTFPYALVQPALGVTGDFFGKTRLMNLCLLVIALSALVCAVATTTRSPAGTDSSAGSCRRSLR